MSRPMTMMTNNNRRGRDAVLVAGSGKLACSVSICLVQAGHSITFLTDGLPDAIESCRTHIDDVRRHTDRPLNPDQLTITDHLTDARSAGLAVIITSENLAEKQSWIARVEALVSAEITVAVNTETFNLSLLQTDAVHPRRVVGANWVEPAHTTCFLELIGNEQTDAPRLDALHRLATTRWHKDPYRLSHGSGIRQRLMAALIREALFLVGNGYASAEDIDRACRNDAGYYLPFAGNGRYMDLMGTYAYGLVMKDLNPELAKDDALAPFCADMLDKGGKGMENQTGFFDYSSDDVADWHEKIRRFSYQIREIIDKYPFDAQPEPAALTPTNAFNNL